MSDYETGDDCIWDHCSTIATCPCCRKDAEIERLEAVREAHVDEICEKNIEIERLRNGWHPDDAFTGIRTVGANRHAKNLRRTRADMLGTDDEEHYWECHAAADEIDRLQARVDEIDSAADAEVHE